MSGLIAGQEGKGWYCGLPKMNCPHCHCTDTRKLEGSTDLGYSRFRCRRCKRSFNQRTGTPFNHLEFPTDIVFQVVLFRLRYKLSLRDVPEMFLLRGFEFTHEAVREWEERFAPLLTEQLRRKRKGKVGKRWYVDEPILRSTANGAICIVRWIEMATWWTRCSVRIATWLPLSGSSVALSL